MENVSNTTASSEYDSHMLHSSDDNSLAYILAQCGLMKGHHMAKRLMAALVAGTDSTDIACRCNLFKSF